MTLSTVDCQALADKIKAAKDRLHDIAMGDAAREISTGGERTAFSNTSRTDLKNHIAELEREYFHGGCAVTLGQNLAKASRAAIKPFF